MLRQLVSAGLGLRHAAVRGLATSALSDAEVQGLVDQAVEAKSRSYSPYSKFRVGAAVLTEDGTVFPGISLAPGAVATEKWACVTHPACGLVRAMCRHERGECFVRLDYLRRTQRLGVGSVQRPEASRRHRRHVVRVCAPPLSTRLQRGQGTGSRDRLWV